MQARLQYNIGYEEYMSWFPWQQDKYPFVTIMTNDLIVYGKCPSISKNWDQGCVVPSWLPWY